MLIAFFGVVFGVNFLMMKLAIQTLPGTEVDSAYSASLGYEKEIAAARDQNARNWKVDAHIQRGPDGGATLQVEARDNSGAADVGLEVSGPLRTAYRQAGRSAGCARGSGARHLSRECAADRGPDNGIWCSKATPPDSGCSCRKIACC